MEISNSLSVCNLNDKFWRILVSGRRSMHVEVEKLFSGGIFRDINAKSGTVCAFTPLMYAIRHQYLKLALWLINNGADVNATDGFGETAVNFAVWSEFDGGIVLLISNGANIKVRRKVWGKASIRTRTAINRGSQIRNKDLKQMQLQIVKQSEIIPVISTMIAEYCYGQAIKFECVMRLTRGDNVESTFE